jgi:ubiquinone biosynthesis protein
LEELGPTFIKLGQVLSTRPDLIPSKFTEEFSKLQDQVPAFSYDEIEAQIKSELGKSIKELFSIFDKKPVAAASLSQVHKAKLSNGRIVAVKIQRPQIENIIEADLAILFNLAKFLEKRLLGIRLYQPVEIIEEFARIIKRELDFIQEGHNIDKFQANFKDSQTVHVPRVYWRLTTSRILTMEFIDGTKISEIAKIKNSEFDRKKIAQRGIDAVLKQIFEDGFFHGDPHPGNIFVLKNNIIVLLDCGMVGYIDEETMNNMADLLIAVVAKDTNKIIKAFEEMDIISEEMNLKELRIDIREFVNKYYGVPLKQLEIGKIGEEVLEVMIRHQIKVPSDLVLLIKALVTIEAIGRDLDPEFDMVGHVKPFVKSLIKKRYSPSQVWKKGTDFLTDSIRLFWSLPEEFRWLVRKLKRGELNIGFQHKGLEKLINSIDKASNRFSFSIIIAALIIGSSLIIQSDKGPLLFDFPILGILGFLVAAILGLGLVTSILRSGKL